MIKGEEILSKNDLQNELFSFFEAVFVKFKEILGPLEEIFERKCSKIENPWTKF